jgi:hypothetical protein
MPFLLILIGALLIVSAYRNTAGTLAADLEQDVPGFAVWALAIGAIGALGWIPGMQTISRWLLALVLVVIVLRNYQGFLSNVKSLGTLPTPTTAPASPASAYVAAPSNPQITAADVSGTAASNVNTTQAASTSSPLGSLDPSAYLSSFESQAGFGGIA